MTEASASVGLLLATALAPVVQRLDNAIHRINHTSDKSVLIRAMTDRISQSSHIASADVILQRDKILLRRANFKRSVGLPQGHANVRRTKLK